MHEPLCFPENSRISPEAMDFIKGLLTRDINRRLGFKEKGFNQLVSHPWLRNIQWELLESKQATPPFIPDVSFLLVKLLSNTLFFLSFLKKRKVNSEKINKVLTQHIYQFHYYL